MAIEDSGFGINSITLVDKSPRTVETLTTLAILPSMHPVFSSDGKDNELREVTSRDQVTRKYGDDFTDVEKYGLQNLNVDNVLKAGGVAYICRLLPKDAKRAHLLIKVGIKPIENIPLYKRDIYGEFVYDEDGNRVPVTYNVTEAVTDEDGHVISEEGQTSKKQVTVNGYMLKIFAEPVPDTIIDRYGSIEKVAEAMKRITTDTDTNYKIFPLFMMYYYANGKCGKDYGVKIINDFKRDQKVSDGRRYELFLTKKTKAGSTTLEIGNDLSFSFNPRATISQFVTSLEGLNSIYQNYDKTVQKQIQMQVYTSNYVKLEEYLAELISQPLYIEGNLTEDEKENLILPESAKEFDFINGYNRDGLRYDNVLIDNVRPYKRDENGEIVKDDDGNPVLDDTWTSSVDLATPQYMQGGTDGSFDTCTDEEALEEIKNDLLVEFFNCQIDKHKITNVLKCDAGIVYDANYNPRVKKAMVSLLNNRRDISVVYDCGFSENLEEAVAYAKDIQSWITPMDGGENFCIVPHCGTTVDRAVNVRVTGTYEFSYGLTRLYRNAPFAVYAGKQGDNGCVRKTIFDWVVEETIPKGYEIKLAKKNKLYWATDLCKAVSTYAIDNDTERNVYFYSNASLYGEQVSKLAEFRNGILVNDIRRMCKLILVKYTFDTDGADEAIRKAKEEMINVFKNRYPTNVVITFDLYQTARDKLVNEASCDITIFFPDIFETWNVRIIADRKE